MPGTKKTPRIQTWHPLRCDRGRRSHARYSRIVFFATPLVLGAAQAARHTYMVNREGPSPELLARKEREDALCLHAPMGIESAGLHEAQPMIVIVGVMRCGN